MYCNKCGKHNTEDSKFCQFCGTKLAKISIKDSSFGKTKTEKEFPQSESKESSIKNKTNIISNYFNVIKKYVDFKGRASRKEYWLFFLANLIIGLGLGYFEGLVGAYPDSEDSIFSSIYQLFVLLPSLAVGVRRMHDANESGWALIIPIFNLIVSLRKGNPETNKYGPAPED